MKAPTPQTDEWAWTRVDINPAHPYAKRGRLSRRIQGFLSYQLLSILALFSPELTDRLTLQALREQFVLPNAEPIKNVTI